MRDLPWGSTTELARLQGRMPAGRPEAELWMGADPDDPSALIGLDGTLQPLNRLLERHPQTLLGGDVIARHGPRLPYLLKLFAVADPLPLSPPPGAVTGSARGSTPDADAVAEPDAGQPHPGPPDAGQPDAGPPDADVVARLLYALQPVDLLAGLRAGDRALDLLKRLDCARLTPVVDVLTGSGPEQRPVAAALDLLAGWPSDERQDLVADVAGCVRKLLRDRQSGAGLEPADRRALIWASRLAARRPDDPLVVAPFLLDVVQLAPADTLFLPAGTPHACLAGFGVELRAARPTRAGAADTDSDDALRPVRNPGQVQLGPYEVAWRPAVEEFQLSRLRPTGNTPIACYPRLRGPQVVLCTAGTVGVATSSYALALGPGESAFVGASGGPITLAGPGEVFRAAVGEPLDRP